MRTPTYVMALLCSGLQGCGFMGISFAEKPAGYRYFFPEPTIVQVAATPEEITYEYSRLYGDEFPVVVAAADRQCKTYAKRAQVVSMVAKGEDRSWATFVCR